jgi:REP element-mobilizing transposase RayT
MPRYARKKSESGILHVMLRGINKQTIFEDDEDRERFLETIERFKTISKYQILGYCLMDNHIHLLLKEADESISMVVKRICSSFVYWYNLKYERCGHLFQERYKSEIVENDTYLLTVLRYIHQNPVKAGLSKFVQDYMWSSYNDYLKKATITDNDFVLEIFSSNREKAIATFITHSNEENYDRCLDYEEKTRLSDNEVREFLATLGTQSISEFQQLDRDKRNEIIRKLKSIEGVTIRQLSRITGLAKSVIDRL